VIFLPALLAFALGATQGPGVDQHFQAVRTTEGIRLDGKLDEGPWRTAPAFDGFTQSSPVFGEKPSERTEVRVLFDDDSLYVGVACFDAEPAAIAAPLGRRDKIPTSDQVMVAIDSTLDHRSAFVFIVNAAGTLADGLFYNDGDFTSDWDGVWDGAAARLPDGWSAELRIPLHVLRFPKAATVTFGFAVRREVPHRHETIDSVAIPRDDRSVVSRFGHLVGLEGLRPARALEATPYAATRLMLRPRSDDATRPTPRLVEPVLDVGADLRLGLSSDLTLNATVNPDFGQVESDQVVLNLTTFETFLPEKRPFFLQGMELFQPLANFADEEGHPPILFYSRRVGIAAPILGAAKVNGSAWGNVQVNVLDAFVAGADVPAQPPEPASDTRWGLHPAQPLRFGPNTAFPVPAAAPQNYFAAAARGVVAGASSLGATVTSAVPMTAPCSAWQATQDPLPPACAVRGGNAAALDFDLRDAEATWQALGQVYASQLVGGLPAETLRDGTVVHPGDAGVGAYLAAGKHGGEPWRANLTYEYESKALDLNASGYLYQQNHQVISPSVAWLRQSGFGPFHRFRLGASFAQHLTADGRVNVGRNVGLGSFVVLPGFHALGCFTGANLPAFDVREIEGAGIALERPLNLFYGCWGGTDDSRAYGVGGFVGAGNYAGYGSDPGGFGVYTDVNFRARPAERVETTLTVHFESRPYPARWVDEDGSGTFYFAPLDSKVLSLTLRQQVVVTPRLTFQAYAQFFSAYGVYRPFYEARARDGRILLSDLKPSTYTGNPSFHESVLNLNLVLRWEWRLGSTFYAVYTRSMTELPLASTEAIPTDLPPTARLGAGPAVDVFLLKWSYWWDV
jgi:hypothetical protein